MEKCKHGRSKQYCCECCYGKIRMESSRHIDALDEINRKPIGYKLLSAYSMFSSGEFLD